MESGGRKGSYFFVIDAFVAAAILAITVIVVLNFFVGQRAPAQSFAYARDYLGFLSSTQVRDFHNEVVRQQIADGNITDPRNTIATQLLLYHNESKDDLAWQLLNATVTSLPADLAVNVSIDDGGAGFVLYNRTDNMLEYRRTHLAVRSIEYTIINQTIYGPYVLLVEVWA